VSTDDTANSGAVHRLLLDRGATVAVAESLTGGLLGAALTSTPGSSATFRGALVVYATELKETLAGVPGPLLDAEGPVSAHVAAALAAGARDRLGSTYGVGVTGVAGPDSQDGHPVGTVHVAVAGPAGGEVRTLSLRGDRAGIRSGAVAAALDLLAEVLARGGNVSP
jgi:nicotinamide-nucleotide amidase